MSYRGIRNWPPVWTWLNGKNDEHPQGEIGTLIDVRRDFGDSGKLFLVIQYSGNEYMGCLLFDNVSFCRQIHDLLTNYHHHPLSEVGDLDISHTL
jgi:hypothetical protein